MVGGANMRFSIVPLLVLILTISQATPKTSQSVDALHLLNDVSQRYANAKSYHIEAVEEGESIADLYRNWQKRLMTAIVTPGGRYRYEGYSAFGSAILVSDGTTEWDYHVQERLYTEQPASAEVTTSRRVDRLEGLTTAMAKDLVHQIGHIAGRLKSATLLADETIVVGGRSFDCYVVQIGNEDLKTSTPYAKLERTIWIDKASRTVRKTLSKGYLASRPEGSYAFPTSETTTTIYPVVELDQPQPSTSFTFAAPPEAKLVAAFPNRSSGTSPEAVDLVGKSAPELRLNADRRVTTLSSYRGKPVFIEFWATWCESCLDLTAELMKLYAETEGKGLVWISIDNDENPGIAKAFMSSEHIPWPNYHDEDGSLGKAFHREGIPLGVLIDADGKVTFYRSGYEISDLRAAIAKLGPQFSSTAPSRGTNPK
jgi:thiol-disulfide isomerase/thioredoxin/outer membrane lipoprotein-sorting protein